MSEIKIRVYLITARIRQTIYILSVNTSSNRSPKLITNRRFG